MAREEDLNRYILRPDPYVPVIEGFDFRQMQKRRKRSWHSRPYEYRFVFDRISQSNLRRIELLDAACGAEHPGYLYYAAHQKIKTVLAVDTDPRLLNNGLSHPKVHKKVGSVDALNVVEGFDMICCVSSLEHTRDYGLWLEKFYRYLRPNGELVLTFDVYLPNKAPVPGKYNIGQEKPYNYRAAAEAVGFKLLGRYSDALPTNAVDAICSEFPLTGNDGQLHADQDNDLKAFRMVFKK